MTTVYRIRRRRFARRPLDGEGSFLFGGRWSNPGTRLAYAAEHLSLAMIEYFVHIDADDPPADLVLVTAAVPDNVSRAPVSPKNLPGNWRQSPAPLELAAIGDRFVRERRSAILRVPSALAPTEWNWLINPEHPETLRIKRQPPKAFRFDSRFFA